MGEDLEEESINREENAITAGAGKDVFQRGALSTWQARFAQQSGWTASLRSHLYSQINLSSAERVLDVGCGPGVLLGELLERSQAQIYGLDLNQAFLALARDEILPKSSGRLSLIQGDAHQLPFRSACFDLALCHFLLLWVRDPVQVLKEMRRVIRPGSHVLVLAEPDYGSRIDHPQELALLGDLQREALRSQGADPDLGRRIGSILRAAGLELVEMGVLGGQWRGSPSPEDLESEWFALRSDLAGSLSRAELDRLQAIDARAWQQGERVLFVPTFYAWGRAPE